MSDSLTEWKYSDEMHPLADQSDRDLLTSFVKDRCERSFTLLVHRYAGMVHGVAVRTLDHAGFMDDVGQLTFLLLAQKASRLLRHEHLAGWLHRTAYQQALNLNRGQSRAQQKHLRHQESIAMSHPDQETWQEIAPILDRELQKLSANDRAILVKRFFAEYSLKELAAHIGISQAAAEKRLQRSLARLRDRLNRNGSGLTISALVAALMIGGTPSSIGALANQWTAQAIQSSPQAISLFTKLITLIAMKKALSVVIVLLLFTLFWSQSPWTPFSSESGRENEVKVDRNLGQKVVEKSGRRRLVKEKSASISGRILDRETGTPVSGAKVSFHSSKFENQASTDDGPGRNYDQEEISDREGHYTIGIPNTSRGLQFKMRVSSEEYCQSFIKISTTWEGHEPDTMGEEGGDSLRGLVRAGDAQIVDFLIAKESPFSGIVLDESGVPIPEVKVDLRYHFGRGGTTGVGSTRSDENGEFEVGGSPASVLSGDLTLSFSHPDFATEILKGMQTMTATARASMKVTLAGRSSLEGRVVDNQGKPVPGAKIVLRGKDKVPYNQWRFTFFTDTNGEFLTKLMWPGDYTISAISMESLEAYDGEVTIQGAGELDLKLNEFAGEKKKSFKISGLSLTPLSPEHCRTFSTHSAKRGGLLVTGFQETESMKNSPGVGNLIYSVINSDSSWDQTDAVLVDDLPSLARGFLKHAKYDDDGTAAAKVVFSLQGSRSISEKTIRLSAKDLIWLKNQAGSE